MHQLKRLTTAASEFSKIKRNWSLYSTGFTGIVFVFVGVMETAVICMFLSFLNSTLGYQLSGSSFIPIVYFSLFILVVGLQLVGAIEAACTSNTMQVIALSLLNLWNFIYSIIQISQLNSFKHCVDSLLVILVTYPSNSTLIPQMAPAILDLQSKCFFAVVDTKTGELPSPSAVLDLKISIQAHRALLDQGTHIQIALCVFMAIASIIGCYLSLKLYEQLGWSQYSTVTFGNIKKRKLIEQFQLFLLFIKINAFLFLGLSLQIAGVGYIERKTNDVVSAQKEAVTQLAVSVLLILLYGIGGVVGAKSLNSWALRLFLVVSVVILAFLIFLITHISQTYKATLIWTVGFDLLAILSDLIAMAICLKIMGHGEELKELLHHNSTDSTSSVSVVGSSADDAGIDTQFPDQLQLSRSAAPSRSATSKSNRFELD